MADHPIHQQLLSSFSPYPYPALSTIRANQAQPAEQVLLTQSPQSDPQSDSQEAQSNPTMIPQGPESDSKSMQIYAESML